MDDLLGGGAEVLLLLPPEKPDISLKAAPKVNASTPRPPPPFMPSIRSIAADGGQGIGVTHGLHKINISSVILTCNQ